MESAPRASQHCRMFPWISIPSKICRRFHAIGQCLDTPSGTKVEPRVDLDAGKHFRSTMHAVCRSKVLWYEITTLTGTQSIVNGRRHTTQD